MAEIDLAEYLFKRLHECGVHSVHGVPGDYNLTVLDYIVPNGLTWVGNCNELNAGYAADGYARVNGMGAIITTFGVGELSAINALTGAYAEWAPVVHIVGTPARQMQTQGAKVHHTICSGSPSDYQMFSTMYAGITVARANLWDEETAPSQIDEVLRECYVRRRPVYLQIPTDMVAAKVPKERLERPLDLSLLLNDAESETKVAEAILSRIYQAKRPFILVDAGASRYHMSQEANSLARILGFPTSTTPFGKGIVNEQIPNFHGVYANFGRDVYIDWVKTCDLVVYIGPFESNINTSYFLTIPDPKQAITFNERSVTFQQDGRIVDHALYPRGVLQRVLSLLDEAKLPKSIEYPAQLPYLRHHLKELPATKPSDLIQQSDFWERISTFFESGDVILTETGTASVGGREFVLPEDTQLLNSSIWLSIGYSLGAAQGVSLALRDSDKKGRTILFQGDGSFQVTAQELSTIIRQKLDVIFFLINNDGYTIERLIHGMHEHYNDIARWNYLKVPEAFGATPAGGSAKQSNGSAPAEGYKITTERATNWGELDEIISKEGFKHSGGLRLVEIMMELEDAPLALKNMLAGYDPEKGS